MPDWLGAKNKIKQKIERTSKGGIIGAGELSVKLSRESSLYAP
jgi:hypothetical protein